MNRLLAGVLYVCLALNVVAQDDPDVVPVPVTGLSSGSRIVAYAPVETETGTHLAAEVVTADGTTAFFIFDYIDDELFARPIGPRSIPTEMRSPPTHRPVTRTSGTAGSRFWRADATLIPDRDEQYVSAPSLEALRFSEIGASPWQLSPPPAHPLAVRHIRVAADGSVLDECVIEPNITAVGDRMSTSGAWWVRPYGEPHLLVGVLFQGAGQEYRGGLRLYNDRNEVVASVPPAVEIDPNAIPDLVRIDLSGDGEEELLFFASGRSPDSPVYVFRYERRSGERRILAFNLCSVRMNGADVVLLQRALAGRGYDLGVHGIDGWYGPDTRAAVIRFQRDAGITVSGIVTDRLWELLGR